MHGTPETATPFPPAAAGAGTAALMHARPSRQRLPCGADEIFSPLRGMCGHGPVRSGRFSCCPLSVHALCCRVDRHLACYVYLHAWIYTLPYVGYGSFCSQCGSRGRRPAHACMRGRRAVLGWHLRADLLLRFFHRISLVLGTEQGRGHT